MAKKPAKPPPKTEEVASDATSPEVVRPPIDLEEEREKSRVLLFRMQMQQPFPVAQVKFKPQMVKGNRALAAAYIDARLVMDRLDEVAGVGGWCDKYKVLQDGSVVCRLTVTCPIRYGWAKVSKSDVGSLSEQPDGGDRLKAAFSDALKRAAVKFGVGRYLYRLGATWADYDPAKKQFTRPPVLPDWAAPKEIGSVYAYHDESELASDASEGTEPGVDSKAPGVTQDAKTPQTATPTQAAGEKTVAAKPEAKKEPPRKKASLDDRLKDWAGKLAACDTPEDATAMIVALKGEADDHKGPIWKQVLATIREVGWAWDGDRKAFFDPSGQKGVPF